MREPAWERYDLPEDVVRAQKRYERYVRALTALNCGAHPKDVARAFKISSETARAWGGRAEWLLTLPSPVKAYLAGEKRFEFSISLRPKAMEVVAALAEGGDGDGRDWLFVATRGNPERLVTWVKRSA